MKKRTYTSELKLETVKPADASDHQSEVARNLGISSGCLRTCRKHYSTRGAAPRSGSDVKLSCLKENSRRPKRINYIETWYNPRHLHSSIGYEAPLEYESKLFAM